MFTLELKIIDALQQFFFSKFIIISYLLTSLFTEWISSNNHLEMFFSWGI